MRYVKLVSIFIVLMAVAAFADVVGNYSGSGSNPGGGGAYDCDVTVTKSGDVYSVQWYIGGALAYDGVGIMKNGLFCVGYAANGYGVVVYEVAADGTLNGVWTTPGATDLGTEVLKKK